MLSGKTVLQQPHTSEAQFKYCDLQGILASQGQELAAVQLQSQLAMQRSSGNRIYCTLLTARL